ENNLSDAFHCLRQQMHEERKENRMHMQSKAKTHAFDTHHNNDITYFGGPRLQAVGIATDEESHFRITEGNFPAKEKSKSKLFGESKRINTRPGCHRDVKKRVNHAVSVSSGIIYSVHIYRTPSRAIGAPQTSSSHQPNSRSPENSMPASAPFRRFLGRTAESSSGARPAASSSLRARIPGRRLSLETRPSIGRSATENGASR
ncbi:hypothetical protein M9458_041388, partial [Cirrhinus mrigala]